MFDHVVFGVSDYAASKAFYLKALEPRVRPQYHPNYYTAFVTTPRPDPTD